MTTLGATPSTTTFPATAADVPFVPAGNIAATNVQAAIEEVAAEVGTLTTEQFAGDGVEDTFTLAQTPMSGYAIVTVNGAQVTTYTITGDDVVFDTPPDNLAEILVNYVYGGGLGEGGGDTRVVVNLTAAQLRLLWTVPVLAIAAPGAGKVIWLKRGFWQYTFVSVAYATSGAVPAFDGSVSGLMVEAGIGLDVTESRTQFQPLTSYPESATHINKAVYIIADPNGIDPGSSGDGTVRITLDYEIFTLA